MRWHKTGYPACWWLSYLACMLAEREWPASTAGACCRDVVLCSAVSHAAIHESLVSCKVLDCVEGCAAIDVCTDMTSLRCVPGPTWPAVLYCALFGCLMPAGTKHQWALTLSR
jgi:hypothetical protein